MVLHAELLVGQPDILVEKTIKILKNHFCVNKSDFCFCNQCKKIKNFTHESIIWINPEKDYLNKDVDIIFQKTSFLLDQNQKFFFILQKAERLTSSTANRLLKILEEPPVGYHFILHTNNLNLILPTIKSRCLVEIFSRQDDSTNYINPVLDFFYNKSFYSPTEFDKTLKEEDLSDSQSIELVNKLLVYYSEKIINFYKNKDLNSLSAQKLEYYEKIISFLKEKLKKLPQSGSSNIFWKNLYLSFPKDL